MIGEHLKDRVHRAAHRVLLRERMIREHRVEERGCQDVLGQHLHRGLVVYSRVQRRAQRVHELLERVLAFRVFQQLFN